MYISLTIKIDPSDSTIESELQSCEEMQMVKDDKIAQADFLFLSATNMINKYEAMMTNKKEKQWFHKHQKSIPGKKNPKSQSPPAKLRCKSKSNDNQDQSDQIEDSM